MNRTRFGWGLMSFLVTGMLLVGYGSIRAADRPITRNLELEVLQEAGRWPNATLQAILALMGQFMASRRDHEGYTYFQERAKAQPDEWLFLALEGLFQARVAGYVPLSQRLAWVTEATAKLDEAVSRAPGITRYLRGQVLAMLPASFGKAEVQVTAYLIASRQSH